MVVAEIKCQHCKKWFTSLFQPEKGKSYIPQVINVNTNCPKCGEITPADSKFMRLKPKTAF